MRLIPCDACGVYPAGPDSDLCGACVPPLFEDQKCSGCGAIWNERVGAFGCGFPLADCGAMVADWEAQQADEDERLAEEAEAEAWSAILADERNTEEETFDEARWFSPWGWRRVSIDKRA